MLPDLQPAVDLLLEKYPDLQAVYAFGSQVNNACHDESDLDLAVLPPRSLDAMAIADMSGALSSRFASVFHHVDLVDLRAANAVLAVQVLETGTILYQSDPRAVRAFELQVMSRYCDLNQERREILADAARRGTILS